MFAEQHAFGPVQIIIVNHGIWTPEDCLLKDMSLDRWNHTLQTNLTSSFLVAREYMRQLEQAPTSVKDGASICFIGSCAGKSYHPSPSFQWPTHAYLGKFGEAYHSDYAVTKSGTFIPLRNENSLTRPQQ